MGKQAAAYFALSASILCAQKFSPDELRLSSRPYTPRASFHVDTSVVEIGVVVRDSHGRPVAGLTKDNFRIQDNGKDREISSFAVDSSNAAPPQTNAPDAAAGPAPSAPARPRFIALFFDDVNTQDEQHANDLKQTREAAGHYLADALHPGVQIAIFTASGAPSLAFTSDAARLAATIAAVQPHPQLTERACVTPYLAYQIAVAHDDQALTEAQYQSRNSACQPKVGNKDDGLADAREVWEQTKRVTADTLASVGQVADLLSTMPGSRVLLLASSGFLAGTLDQDRENVVDRALRGGVVINSLDSKGVYGEVTPFGGHPTDANDIRLAGAPSAIRAGINTQQFNVGRVGMRAETLNAGLETLAEETGGTFFHNSNDLHAGFVELANPPATAYRLSFRPGDIASDGSYHKLKISLIATHGDSVQARKGYFAPRAGPSAESKVDAEMFSSDVIADFPADVSGETAKLKNGQTDLSVLANVDISKLEFTRQGNRRKQTIRFISALLDAQGKIVAAKEATMELSLKQATYDRLLKTGLTAKLTLQAHPGAYRLREVVEESSEHKLNCSTHDLNLP